MIRMDVGDAENVALALGGDQDAFRVLVERHSRTLFRLAHRMTGNEQDRRGSGAGSDAQSVSPAGQV